MTTIDGIIMGNNLGGAEDTEDAIDINAEISADMDIINSDIYEPEPKTSDATIECACCFNDIDMDSNNLVQCSGGHLFCSTCIVYLIQSKMSEGASILQIYCISSKPPCTETIPPMQLRLALGNELWTKYMEKYDNENLERAILQENSNLEQCGFCNYVMEVMQNKNELKILTCPNRVCGKKMCRLCRKESHDPLTCAQVKTEGGRMLAEEMLTRALIRHCPKCEEKGISTVFVKDDGCNKMKCPKCKCNVCYLCETVVDDDGHGHFTDHNIRESDITETSKCPLWAKDSDKITMNKRQKIIDLDPQFQKNGARRLELRVMSLVELLKICRSRGYTGFPLYNLNDLVDFIISCEVDALSAPAANI